jgi:hypothetical protein
MLQKKLKLIAFLLLGLGLSGLKAQEAVPASGGNASGSGGSSSYSVGQVVCTTNSGATGSQSQGVQQPYEILVVTALAKTQGIVLHYSVYPNPSRDLITLKVENYNNENLSYQLFDLLGNLLESKKLEGPETGITISGLIHASYFLKVIENNKEIKIFKIIKN